MLQFSDNLHSLVAYRASIEPQPGEVWEVLQPGPCNARCSKLQALQILEGLQILQPAVCYRVSMERQEF